MDYLIEGFKELEWQQPVMWLIGCILIYLAIKRDMEPMLLLPIGLGCILVNMPLTNVLTEAPSNAFLIGAFGDLAKEYSFATQAVGGEGVIEWLFKVGIEASEAMPILLFIGIGAMIDFGPLISNPKLMFMGAFAQLGIFITVIFAVLVGFNLNDAASVGIIGAADGPTSILVAQTIGAPELLGPITIVAYSYMALVPIIQPPVIKLVTTKKQRLMRMDDQIIKPVPKVVKILFPIVITIIAGLIAPKSLALVGFLMFGNLLRECGVLNQLSKTAQNELVNLITLLLGITISFKMIGSQFLTIDTLKIVGLGLLAFIFDTIGGVLFADLMNLFSKKKINPMIGAAGISAFPMSARVVHKLGRKEDPTNYLLMHAVGVNVSGQVASAIVGGLIIALVLG
ncbi:MAG: sodium ion-translocating decarboxylase subunit beta [Clostridiales bacterium]|jgi:oxaloacetate decarboxylase beta subunit|nr:sodium ion-translocating decarboxylase subunit beta [Clostridiales bacterium]